MGCIPPSLVQLVPVCRRPLWSFFLSEKCGRGFTPRQRTPARPLPTVLRLPGLNFAAQELWTGAGLRARNNGVPSVLRPPVSGRPLRRPEEPAQGQADRPCPQPLLLFHILFGQQNGGRDV